MLDRVTSFPALLERLRRDPRLWPIAQAVDAIGGAGTFPSVEDLDAALATKAGVRFVEAAARPRRRPRRAEARPVPYDTRIDRDGEVPTRAGSVHDLMNALVWASFPRAKRALHARQRALVVPAARFESQRRPRALDALALLDEGGVLLAADGRAAVFGHAVYEGMALGWPDPLGSALPLDAARGTVESLDAALAERLEGGGLTDPAELGRYDLAAGAPSTLPRARGGTAFPAPKRA